MITAIDLFAGCGGGSEGLTQAGFQVISAVELDSKACEAYSLNHPNVNLIQLDIRLVTDKEILKIAGSSKIHLLVGCPPCQGFSSIRRLNRPQEVQDGRNDLVMEYLRFVKLLKPLTIMLENVPALKHFTQFKLLISELEALGYNPQVKIDQIQAFGIPQRRKRLIMVGSLLGLVQPPIATGKVATVRDAIGDMESVHETKDWLHRKYPKHTPAVMKRIEMTPKDGGSRKDVPELELNCHKKPYVGFNDVYGRLKWDAPSTTITGGCLNPSKGRFLHPEENRCITAREAALLQTFPPDYMFPAGLSLSALALQIGNAIPPEYIRIQAENIAKHLKEHGID